MFFRRRVTNKAHLFVSFALLSAIYQPSNANAESLQTTKLSVLSLDMERDEAVALLTEDGWEVNKGAFVVGNKTIDGDRLNIKGKLSEVSDGREAITQIEYERRYGSTKVDIETIKNAVIERYGQPNKANVSKSVLDMEFSDSGEPVKSADLMQMCEKAGGDSMKLMNFELTDGFRFPMHGIDLYEELCPSIADKYVSAMEAYHAPKMTVWAETRDNLVRRILTWSLPSTLYLYQKEQQKNRDEQNKPKATLD